MRSKEVVLEDLGRLDSALQAFEIPALEEYPGVTAMRTSLLARRDVVTQELAAISDSLLAMVFDGPSVRDHAIDAGLLVKQLGPFQRAIDAAAQALADVATKFGKIPDAILGQSRLFVTGTFAGSFGLELSGPEHIPQLRIDGTEDVPLFDRAVDSVLDVLAAASDFDGDERLVETISYMGDRAISHIEELAQNAASDSNWIKFQHKRPGLEPRTVELNAMIGRRLADVTRNIETSEVEQDFVGRLNAGDVERMKFGITLESDETIRGNVNPAIIDRLIEYFGREVRGTLVVRTTRSTVTESASKRYYLDRLWADLDS